MTFKTGSILEMFLNDNLHNKRKQSQVINPESPFYLSLGSPLGILLTLQAKDKNTWSS